MENAQTIPGWPEYKITEFGDVYRVAGATGAKVGRKLKWTLMNNGYAKVALCKNSCKHEYLVHRLVAMTFIGNPTGKDVCHYDGNKLNNNLLNLRIDSRYGNMQDQIRMGKTPRGEKCGSNKYTKEFVIAIRNRMDKGASVSKLHKELLIPKSTLYNIRARNTWAWL